MTANPPLQSDGRVGRFAPSPARRFHEEATRRQRFSR